MPLAFSAALPVVGARVRPSPSSSLFPLLFGFLPILPHSAWDGARFLRPYSLWAVVVFFLFSFLILVLYFGPLFIFFESMQDMSLSSWNLYDAVYRAVLFVFSLAFFFT